MSKATVSNSEGAKPEGEVTPMSIEHQSQPDLPNFDTETGEPLQTYLLNGQEIRLTAKQAEDWGAQKIGHSGDLGLESPAIGAWPVTHEIPADDIAPTMPFNPKDLQQAREIQRGTGRNRLGWKRPVAVATLVAAAVGGAFGIGQVAGGDNTPDRDRQEPQASAPADPTESVSTPDVDPTNGPEVSSEPPARISIEKYPDPAAAAEQSERLRTEFISGNNSYFNYYRAQESVFNSDTMQYEQDLSYGEYQEAYLTAIFGDLDREDPMIRRTIELKDLYDSINEDLRRAFPDGSVQYRIEFVGMDDVSVEGTTVTYDAQYKVNTEDIPKDYRDKELDESDNPDHRLGSLTLSQQNGNWTVIDSEYVN